MGRRYEITELPSGTTVVTLYLPYADTQYGIDEKIVINPNGVSEFPKEFKGLGFERAMFWRFNVNTLLGMKEIFIPFYVMAKMGAYETCCAMGIDYNMTPLEFRSFYLVLEWLQKVYKGDKAPEWHKCPRVLIRVKAEE
jgi:hypothetical protein